MRRLFRRPSHATVVAYLALFVALGGSAMAAFVVSSNSQIGPNTIYGSNKPSTANDNIVDGSITARDIKASSIGSTQIFDGSLIGADLDDGTVAGIDIKPSAITTSRIADGAVTGADLVNNTLTGTQINESTLAQVPSALHADDTDTLDGMDAKQFARLAGVVNEDGSVSQGTGFSVMRLDAGEYQVSFPNGTLAPTGCPPIVVATAFSAVYHAVLYARGCNGLGAGNFTVKMLDSAGTANDAPFLFIAI
jgi:hypothetical protein